MRFPFLILRRSLVPALLATAAVGSAVAEADDTSMAGGTAAPERPRVAELRCQTGEASQCPRGEVLTVAGENLSTAQRVVFLGRRGKRDDRVARAVAASAHSVSVRVPAAANSGRVRVVSKAAGPSDPGPRLRIVQRPAVPAPLAAAQATGGVFPVSGPHDYGTETNRFGGGRGHKGQDVFAACGTPVVAAVAGTVTIAKFQDRAGNYAVIKADDGTGQAYMHLLRPATVLKGDRVEAGQEIGKVGQTGRASGCHLHFELWTAPGWYEGGEPIDPLPQLQRWDAVG